MLSSVTVTANIRYLLRMGVCQIPPLTYIKYRCTVSLALYRVTFLSRLERDAVVSLTLPTSDPRYSGNYLSFIVVPTITQ